MLTDRYMIDRRLGAGRFGSVYRARDVMLELPVAIRLVNAHEPGVAAAVRRMMAMHRGLRHPNVCRVLDLAPTQEGFGLVMDLVDGRPLAADMSNRVVTDALVEVCAGLAAAHAAGLSHGDLGPGSVLVALDGTAQLVDVGLAEALGNPADAATDIEALKRLVFDIAEVHVGRGGIGAVREALALSAMPTQLMELPRAAATVSSSLSDKTVAGRYRVGQCIGKGGMGAVFRAVDTHDGSTVGIKIVSGSGSRRRFQREANALKQLNHPGIVRYLDHGVEPGLGHYLVMTWLEGETLAGRLARSSFTVREAVDILRQTAEAVGAAHRIELVHRDLKPANIMLGQTPANQVTLIDFGLSLQDGASERLTQTGTVMGTVGYMAPEQARGATDIGVRADVFALGSILFECITRSAAFPGLEPMAVLAKVCLVPAPELGVSAPEVPESLCALVDRMLAKDPLDRPRDANEVAAELARIHDSELVDGEELSAESTRMGSSESLLLSVMLVGLRGRVPTPALRQDISRVASAHGAVIDELADGTTMLHWRASDTPRARAARLGSCSEALAALMPPLAVAAATGKALVHGGRPVGEVIDRVVTMFGEVTEERTAMLDESTADLLEQEYELEPHSSGALLRHTSPRTPPPVLCGKRVPCRGRDTELRILSAHIDACVTKRRAAAILLEGEAGIGKSRVLREVVDALSAHRADFRLWMGQAEPVNVDSPFAVAASVLRNAFDEDLAVLLNVDFYDLRDDPTTRHDQLAVAWDALIDKALRRGPLAIVIEDLHWGDAASLMLFDRALRLSTDRPLAVICTARPEVHDHFPQLFRRRDLHLVAITPLAPSDCDRIVRDVLSDVSPKVSARIVELASGSPFYLEELIRAEAAGADELPTNVLALVQRRLEALEPQARQILRAACVFGRAFWAAGVTKLLGEDAQVIRVDGWLDALVQNEVFARQASTLGGQEQLVFRHPLVRDAAYAMLSDRDRRVGHALAARWLTSVGVRDTAMLAEHYELGHKPLEAATWWSRAAAAALAGNDLHHAIQHAQRAIDGGAQGEAMVTAHLVQCEAHIWSGDEAGAAVSAERVMRACPEGDRRWCEALVVGAFAHQGLCNRDQFGELVERLLAAVVHADPELSLAAVVRVATYARRLGDDQACRALATAFDRLATTSVVRTPRTNGFIHRYLATEAEAGEDLAGCLKHMLATVRSFEEAGALRIRAYQQVNAGFALYGLGLYEDAELQLRQASHFGRRMGLEIFVAFAEHNLGIVRHRVGHVDEAVEWQRKALAIFRERSVRRLEGASLIALADARAAGDALEEAKRTVAEAIACLESKFPALHAEALGLQASIFLRLGDPSGAHDRVLEALTMGSTRRSRGFDSAMGELAARLAHAEIAEALGRRDESVTAITDAKRRLDGFAAQIGDDEWRRCFLGRVPTNTKIQALFRQLECGRHVS